MSLIHWWPLNGNLKDCGLLNTTLTNINSTAINNNGKIGKCYYFNGSNNALRAEYPNTTKPVNALSLAGWYKAVSTSSDHYIISCYETGGAGLAGASGSIKFQIYSSGAYSSATASVPDTNWHHWCGTFDGRYIKLYMDGVLKQTTDLGSSGRTITYHSTTCWMMGANPYNDSPAGNYTNGYINDVRIYDHALSLKEIKEISKGLVLHYTFEDAYAEGTTNLCNTLTNMSSWGTYANLTTTTISSEGTPCPSSEIKYSTFDVTTAGGNYFRSASSVAVDASSTYTISVYIKTNCPFHRNHLYWRRYNSSGTQIDEGGKAATTQREYLGNGWYRYYATVQTTAETAKINFETYFYPSAGTGYYVYYGAPQLEKKDHVTPYVNGARQPSLIYDSSGNGYNGTQNGAIQILNESPSGKHCAKFDSNIYIDIPTLPELKSATISFWAKIPTNTTAYRSIFNRKNSPTGGLWLSLNTESYGMWSYVAGSPSYSGAGAKIAADTWYLFTFVFDNGVANWYQNGVYVGRNITYDTYKAIASANYCLGDSYTGSSWDGTPFDGSIADFKIFATALSASDILAEYQTKASIDRDGNLYTGEFVEENDRINIAKTDVVESSVFEEGTSLVKMTDKYVELEYIQSNGNQVIDTGYDMTSNNLIFEDVYEYAALTSNEACIGGTSTGSSSPGFEFGNTASKFFNYSSTHTTSAYGPGTPATNTKYYYRAFISATKYSCEINGVLGTPVSKTISITGQRVRINRYYGSGHNLNGKQYLIRIWDNGVLVRNFIPAKRKSDNVVGLYDTVNRQFYTNSGSGSFTAGPEKGNLSIVYSKQIIEN